MNEEVKLLGLRGSPFSSRVETVLNMKGIPYEYLEDDIDNKSPLLLKYNPVHKKIPVLLYNGKPIAESLVIIEFIDENWKHNPILPKDPYQRAVERFWAKFVDDKCTTTLWKACWSRDNEAMKESLESLKILESELKEKTFFGGETIGFVDIAANFIGYWLGMVQEASGVEILTQDKFPRLYKWTQNFENHKIIKNNLPERNKMVALFKARYGSGDSAKAK